MRPRIARLKISRPPGRKFEDVKQGCSWCERGADPAPGQEICERCVRDFKSRLASYRWRMARMSWFTAPEHHYCKCGCGRLAELIDHIRPWRFFPSLFWCCDNWQSMFGDCNKRKAVEDNRKYRSVG
jgi:5-methylcytosine-specific restriction endonuclease McrA